MLRLVGGCNVFTKGAQDVRESLAGQRRPATPGKARHSIGGWPAIQGQFPPRLPLEEGAKDAERAVIALSRGAIAVD